MEEYVTITDSAKQLGVTTKRIQRAIRAGELSARYPYPNKAEISPTDLRAWHAGLYVRAGEMQDRLVALETRVSKLETEIQDLRHQLEASPMAKKKAPPKIDTDPPEGLLWLSDFCHLHRVPYQAALELFPHAIHGQKIGSKRRNYPAIGPRGQRDFWVQLHTRADYATCDDCPYEEHEQHI